MRLIPKDPPEGLLLSMAIRYDHGLGVEDYYDQPMFLNMDDHASHARKLESTIGKMRQLYEEVAGKGFYVWDKEMETK